MKRLNNPPSRRPESGKQPGLRVNSVATATQVKGLSGWRALEREQFRALVASPSPEDRPGGGSKS